MTFQTSTYTPTSSSSVCWIRTSSRNPRTTTTTTTILLLLLFRILSILIFMIIHEPHKTMMVAAENHSMSNIHHHHDTAVVSPKGTYGIYGATNTTFFQCIIVNSILSISGPHKLVLVSVILWYIYIFGTSIYRRYLRYHHPQDLSRTRIYSVSDPNNDDIEDNCQCWDGGDVNIIIVQWSRRYWP